jgi:hypothetical protein
MAKAMAEPTAWIGRTITAVILVALLVVPFVEASRTTVSGFVTCRLVLRHA